MLSPRDLKKIEYDQAHLQIPLQKFMKFWDSHPPLEKDVIAALDDKEESGFENWAPCKFIDGIGYFEVQARLLGYPADHVIRSETQYIKITCWGLDDYMLGLILTFSRRNNSLYEMECLWNLTQTIYNKLVIDGVSQKELESYGFSYC